MLDAPVLQKARSSERKRELHPSVVVSVVTGRVCRNLKLCDSSVRAFDLRYNGMVLPSTTGTVLGTEPRILCISPIEWLAVGDTFDALPVGERSTCATEWTVVDFSDGIVVVSVKGQAARSVLSKSCGLDFHPKSFMPGQCARTLLAKIAVIVDCVGEEHFHLYAGLSYQRYLTDWLADAAAEFRA